jgi:hypothetical protein
VGLSIFLARRMGIIGVALGTTIPTSITAFGFYLPYAARMLDVRLSRVLRRLLLPLGVCATTYVTMRFAVPAIEFPSLVVFAAAGGTLVAACMAASIMLDREERKTYLGVAQAWGRQLRAQS